jgi:hypothetical protein
MGGDYTRRQTRFAVPLNSIVFSNAEYPAGVPSWPVQHGRIMWITKKGFLLLLFRIDR